MVDPMFQRLAGCLVFASLLGTLMVVATEPYAPARRDAVAVAELQQRVVGALFTRQ